MNLGKEGNDSGLFSQVYLLEPALRDSYTWTNAPNHTHPYYKPPNYEVGFPTFSCDIVGVVDNLIRGHITITNCANPPSALVQSPSDIHASCTDTAAKRSPRDHVCMSSRSARDVTGGVIWYNG